VHVAPACRREVGIEDEPEALRGERGCRTLHLIEDAVIVVVGIQSVLDAIIVIVADDSPLYADELVVSF
jgi:hypothetical protein